MDIKYKKQNSSLTLYLYGELDECFANKSRDIIDEIIMQNANVKVVVFDLSGLTFMDSTGLGLLIGRYKKLKQLNISAYISGANISTEKVIEVAGLYKIMPKL